MIPEEERDELRFVVAIARSGPLGFHFKSFIFWVHGSISQ